MKTKTILLLLFIVISQYVLYANISAPYSPPSWGGDIFIKQQNSLRVVTETISYDINRNDFIARVNVHYEIINDGSNTFSEQVFFVAAEHSTAYARGNRNYRVMVNGRETDFTEALNIHIQDPGREDLTDHWKYIYDGFVFNISINPGEKITIDIEYSQWSGWSRYSGGSSYASLSHFLNLGKGSEPAKVYSYQIFPIKTFGGGVDQIIIKIKYPYSDSKGYLIDNFQCNIPLAKKKCTAEFCELEQTFDSIPADTLDISFDISHDNNFGFTITPLYMFSYNDDKNTWAGSISADYILRHSQVSAGFLWNFDDRMQTFQEMKFFPQGYPYYINACIDYRFGAGIVEQFRPEKDFGFRVFVGVRAFLAFECVYQVFPSWITGRWNHELLLCVPLSF